MVFRGGLRTGTTVYKLYLEAAWCSCMSGNFAGHTFADFSSSLPAPNRTMQYNKVLCSISWPECAIYSGRDPVTMHDGSYIQLLLNVNDDVLRLIIVALEVAIRLDMPNARF